jgi:hypothetical protein
MGYGGGSRRDDDGHDFFVSYTSADAGWADCRVGVPQPGDGRRYRRRDVPRNR